MLNESCSLVFCLNDSKKNIYSNKLINSYIQKGCMGKVHGCWEYMSVVWDKLKPRKTEKSNIAAIRLDIVNAYGSVPHQLLFFALRRYGIPVRWLSLFIKYYEGLWNISWSDSAPSNWQHHLRGNFHSLHSFHYIVFIHNKCYHRTYLCSYRR